MANDEIIIKCLNCEKLFYSEDELEIIKIQNDEFIKACPICMTDKYLMDIKPR